MKRFLAALGCWLVATAATPPPEAWFEEVAASAGITFEHVRAHEIRYWFPEIMSGGGGWCDYDGDGWLDLYLVQGGSLEADGAQQWGNRLYRNLGEGTFVDVTERAGVGDPGYGMGLACGDYDGDGWLDLYVTNVGRNRLYRNLGDGTFRDVTEETATGHPGWGTAAAFVDFDRDGDLDLFVVNYVEWSPAREIHCASGSRRRDYCQPQNYSAPARDTLLRNDGERFTDVSAAAGLDLAWGNGLGVAVADFNGDGLPDLYVANDGDPNQLWMNRQGRFRNEALASGAAVNLLGTAEAGMGVVAADVDDDGDTDLFVTHLRGESNTLYRNVQGFFEDATARLGLAAPSLALTGFGAGLADFDHDGWRDLYVTNGRVGQSLPALVAGDPFAEPDLLFRGRPGGFEEVLPRGGTQPTEIANGRAAAFADYDNDGDIDIAVVNNGSRVRLLRNRAGTRGAWLTVRALSATGADELGTGVIVAAAGRRRWRTVQTAYSYCASNDPRTHFGLADSAAAWVEIRRPGGTRLRLLSPPSAHLVFGRIGVSR